MDPGTILSIVQLSLSAFELGSKIAREFLSRSDRVPDKLKRLNDRLGRFHTVVKNIIQEPQKHNAPSNLKFPGADDIIETLSECKEFLRQYESALLSHSTVVGASQRLALLVGPDNSKVDELDKRIMYHYTELQYWKTVAVEDAVKRLGESMVAMHVSPQIPSLTGSPQLESSTGFAAGQSNDNHMARSRSGFPRSPTLKANPRNPSLSPINEIELPSPRAGNNYTFDVAAQRQLCRSTGTGPVMAYIGHDRQDTASSASTLVGSEYNIGPLSPSPLSTTPPQQFQGQGYSVWLYIGSRRYQFTTTCYRILDSDGNRVAEWYNTSSGVTIQHFVPSGCCIPHTKPTDEKLRVSFLPPSTKHHFRITEADQQAVDLEDRAQYQFARKMDRDIFQQNLRGYESLEIIRASKIHSAAKKDIATLEHLKVWRQTDYDDKPTISFAAHGVGRPLHHEEFYIRWFKRTPELKGDTRLILRMYSKESDHEKLLETEGARRRSSTFGSKVRKLSGNSSHGGPSRPKSRSRSSSSKAPAPVLYEYFQGIEPPSDIRNLGHLEIEFKDSELRRSFIKACYEAHRPAMAAARNGTPSPVLSQQKYTGPPTLMLGPQQDPYELGDSARYELMGDFGSHEMMHKAGVYEMGSPSFQIPSPSLNTPYSPEEVHFNTETLFLPSRTAASGLVKGVNKEYGTESLTREPGSHFLSANEPS
ncbi:uncharacterized protein F4807DRAFT_328823 [Annulohypoxylon truncatum]|uniref:uncharacterized protein n=1 Tax=Annulohypoxylon truncatum TaxID=327061 RepID=UPI002007D7E6|nr:uncharacterized protein F4807DRAFT_328823 [Annulohypoxylon truncatum]KAI1204527.1 hypothetical protein F4807DRAFT_328823 [Annulohypoxylon truncatum]